MLLQQVSKPLDFLVTRQHISLQRRYLLLTLCSQQLDFIVLVSTPFMTWWSIFLGNPALLIQLFI